MCTYMGTRTISITDEAYDRLKSAKRDDESFSDVVNRISPGVRLDDYWGVLDDESADELHDTISDSRNRHGRDYEKRMNRITSDLDVEGAE